MRISKRLLGLFILISSLMLLTSCNSPQLIQTLTQTPPGISEREATTVPTTVSLPTQAASATQLPFATATPHPTASPTFTSTSFPAETLTSTSTSTPTQKSGVMVPGIYGSGGCNAYWITFSVNYMGYGAHITWCVDHVEVSQDGSMIFVMNWNADYDFYQDIWGRFTITNKNLFLSDNQNNRYDPITVNINQMGSMNMVPGTTYYGTIAFPHANPGAYRFVIHDPDNKSEISDILMIDPVITINEITTKFYPLVGSYYSDKWNASETKDGGFWLAHKKYALCEMSEEKPGKPQGSLINTIEIGSLKYDIYRTHQKDFSLREYVLVGGVDEAVLATKPLIIVTIPYDNPAPCLDDIGSVLASFHTP